MTKKQLAAAQAGVDAATGKPVAVCDECNLTGAHAEGCSKRPASPRDLDDAATQAEIIEPTPKTLTIGGAETKTYPLPARWSRKFVGLFARIAKASSDVFAPMTVKFGIAIDNDDALEHEVMRFFARAEHPADAAIDDEALDARADEISEAVLFDERRDLLDALCVQNRLTEIINGPKTQPAPVTKIP